MRLGYAVMKENSRVLVLDGAQAVTFGHLTASGVPKSKIFVPNIYTSSVASLRRRGVSNAFCCDVNDVLEQARCPLLSPPSAPPSPAVPKFLCFGMLRQVIDSGCWRR